MSDITWTCGDCSHTEDTDSPGLAGELYEKEIHPVGYDEPFTVTAARCPNCQSNDWKTTVQRGAMEKLNR